MYEMLTGLPPFYSQDVQQMYFKIMHAKLDIPEQLDEHTKVILLALLERDPNKRLSDPSAIKSHPYFKEIDWEKLLKKEIKAPFIPPLLNGKMDVSMVDPAFTSEKPTISDGSDPTDGKISLENQKKFDGFTFIPDDEVAK